MMYAVDRPTVALRTRRHPLHTTRCGRARAAEPACSAAEASGAGRLAIPLAIDPTRPHGHRETAVALPVGEDTGKAAGTPGAKQARNSFIYSGLNKTSA